MTSIILSGLDLGRNCMNDECDFGLKCCAFRYPARDAGLNVGRNVCMTSVKA